MVILCIDLKSFYASVECILRGLDPLKVNLVVADKTRGPGSVILAVSPNLKKYGVKTASRIFDIPKGLDVIYATPRMKKYLEYSSAIYNIYLNYVSKEDIHVYSIDEAFLDLTTYMKYYNMSSEEIATKIITEIVQTTGITGTCGIGDNMFLAKVALDVLAKHQPSNIAYLNVDLLKKHVWDVPIREIWGVGHAIEKRLAHLGIHTLRGLAKYPLPGLEKEFGIIGRELLEHAYGIDSSTVQEVRNYKPLSKSFGRGQVMFEDYNYKDMYTILLETVEEIVTELVIKRLDCQLIGLGISYSKEINHGFSRQMTLGAKTNSKKTILEGFTKLYNDNIEDYPIRRIDVRVGKLSKEDYVQTDIFTNPEDSKKEHELYLAIGEIKERFGRTAVHMAAAKDPKSTYLKRNKLIGGHNAE
jgi:DNA polymerase V